MLTITFQTETKYVEVSTSELGDESRWSDILPMFLRILKGADYCFDVNDYLGVVNDKVLENDGAI